MPNPVKSALGGMRGEGAEALDPARRQDVFDLSKLCERVKLAEMSRRHRDELDALEVRVADAPAKLAAARAKGVDPKKLKAAEMKAAELEDEYRRAVRAEVEWLTLSTMYYVGKNIANRLRPAIEGSVSPTFSISIPGLVTATLALDGPDDEPPF